MLFDVSSIGMTLKRKFDRVRPSYLDSRIVPAIAVPEHAAYPSNHSLEAHFLALVLGELYPLQKAEFWKAADAIALNREIAGVHYRSDSQAGADMARIAFRKISQNLRFREFIAQHRSVEAESSMQSHSENRAKNCQELVAKNIPR